MARGALLNDDRLNTFKPVLRAYGLSYAASVGPRLFGFLRTARRRDLTTDAKLKLLVTILKTSTQLNRFPTAAAILIAGPTIITRLIHIIIQWLVKQTGRSVGVSSGAAFVRRLRFACSLLSAWVAFDLLNRDKEWARKRARSRGMVELQADRHSPNQHHLPPPGYQTQYAGKTIDFTLFNLFRALDVLAINVWTRTRCSAYHPEKRALRLSSFAKRIADPWIFASSASIIMWAWFYSPERLPRAYNQWISTAADLDSRLLTVLRRARNGDFIYGRDTGQGPVLMSLCDELGLPQHWGDPARTVPIPCELYHCGRGKSCEVHAASRFWRSWIFSMELYLPLQLLTKIRSPNKQAIIAAIRAAARSSSFLAAFVASFYYSVCLARTRLGPKIFSRSVVTPQMWDSGLCILAGCMACGWSILLEKAGRRQEIAFFVAPRALATLLPRVYDRAYQRREQVAFAISAAVVLSAAKSGPNQTVRGVLGRVLQTVLRD